MIKLINKVTGTVMYVADDKADKYLAAGHAPAVKVEPPKKPAATKKPATKKTTKGK